jgi:DHA1 family bicyclomycin/chloramphenicol resistance-like MFS transporter
MNLIGLILGIGPALAPTLGGLTLTFFGWHAIFIFMLIAGVVIILVVHFSMVETVTRDLSRIHPAALMRSYRTLLTDPYFTMCSLVLGGGIGAIYTLATILPFILIGEAGLTPTEFGLGMLMQSGSFFLGSLVVRRLMGKMGAYRLVPVGLVFIGFGSLAVALSLTFIEPTFLSVMVPVGIFVFGNAFTMPAMTTASLAAYPHMAGAAASMNGFFQMGGGLVGGIAAAMVGDPVTAMAIVIPTMGVVAILAWLYWRTLPEPTIPAPR